MTGTPSGVDRLAPGHMVEIEGIGRLRNIVVADPSAARRPLLGLSA